MSAADTRGDVLALVAGALVDGAHVAIVTFFVVNAAVLLGHVDAVAVLAVAVLARLGNAVVGGLAAFGFVFVLALPLAFSGGNVADVDGADVCVVAHPVGGAAVLFENVGALVIGAATVGGAAIAVVALDIGEAAARLQVVVAVFRRAGVLGADVVDAVGAALALGWRHVMVHVTGVAGDHILAVHAVVIDLATAAGGEHPLAQTVFARVDSARIAVVADDGRGARSAALGAHRRVVAHPAQAFVYGAADAVVAFQRCFTAVFPIQDLVFAYFVLAGPCGTRVVIVAILVVVAAVRVVGVLVDAEAVFTVVIGARVVIDAGFVCNARLALVVNAGVHLAVVIGGRVVVVTLGRRAAALIQ